MYADIKAKRKVVLIVAIAEVLYVAMQDWTWRAVKKIVENERLSLKSKV